MNCLICHTTKYRPGETSSEFDVLFGDIVRSCDEYWWGIQSSYDVFAWPPDWIGEDEILEPIYAEITDPNPNSRFNALMTSAIFRKYIHYFRNDWCDVIGFEQRPKCAPTKTYEIAGLPNLIEFPDTARLYIVNVDSAFWALITEDRKMIETVGTIWPHSELVEVAIRTFNNDC